MDEKRVELTDEQYRVLRESFRSHEDMGEVCKHLIVSLLDEMQRRQDRTWDQVAQLLGFEWWQRLRAENERLLAELGKPCPTCERRKQWARQVARQECPANED